MANIYVDGELTTGTNNGGSWANAYQGNVGLQAACDAAVAADILNLARTFTLAALIDIDQTSGTQLSPIRVIGYNYNSGSPIVDGTFSTLDGNSAVNNCILANNIDNWIFENIEFKYAKDDNAGVTGAACKHWSFINCHSHHALGTQLNTGDGWGGSGTTAFDNVAYVLCQAYSNAQHGFLGYHAAMFGCTSHDNIDDGYSATYSMFNNCIAYSNGDHGFKLSGNENLLVNCVSDGNADTGVYVDDGPSVLAGCRITNNTWGIRGDASATVLDFYNFLQGNTVPTINCTVISTIKGQNTRTTTGDEGYINRAAGNFGLLDTAAARRMEVQL